MVTKKRKREGVHWQDQDFDGSDGARAPPMAPPWYTSGSNGSSLE